MTAPLARDIMQLKVSCKEVTSVPTKEKLIEKLCRTPAPNNFTVNDLSALMAKCHCTQGSGGRGSGIRYYHTPTGRVLIFDGPHPGKELYRYQVRKVIEFLTAVGEIPEGAEKHE